MIGALNKKLLRDIAQIKGQLLAIMLVMAAGIAMFVIMFGVLDSLRLTQSTYYDRYQLADVFVSLKRAPQSLKQRVSEIPGVSMVQSRVIFGVTLQIPNMVEPASGKIISLPDGSEPLLNKLYLRTGRFLYPNEQDAILADESFVNAHHLVLGDKVAMIMNGHLRRLKIVGVVLSPEYVYTIAPGALMPDPRRFGIFWMSRRSLEAAVNMKGAFNDLALKIQRDGNIEQIKSRLDRLLMPYGGLIAYGRDEQLSNFFVENELKQLESLGLMAPIIFLSVAAFLIYVVMSRQVATQREQIGMLKAVGYTNREISLHYLKMVLLISSGGAVIGLSLGAWMGAGMIQMYTEFFHFPLLSYSFSPQVMIFAVFFCALAAVSGTLFAIRSAANLPPAEAMRAPSPTVFKLSLLARLGVHRQLSFLSRIVLRQLERRPWRALLSALGLAFACAMLIFSFFMADSMQYLMNIQYDVTQREDLSIAFVEPLPYRALEELRALPGVLKVEPLRQVAVNLRVGHIKKRSMITGLVTNPDLRRVIDKQLAPVPMPSQGLVINNKLADIFRLGVGDVIEIEVLTGKRANLSVRISAITEEFMGMGVFMDIRQLNNLLDEAPKITGASLSIDQNYSALLYQKLKQLPMIIGLNINSVLRTLFEQLMAQNLLKMVSINILFASFISFGIIYNTARITLSERGRELASLRVLGLTRREVGYILFGELGVITLLSLPLGMWIGYSLAMGMVQSLDSELFRLPVYINNSTYGYAAVIVLSCATFTCYLVWRQIDKIDLVSAQKGVE